MSKGRVKGSGVVMNWFEWWVVVERGLQNEHGLQNVFFNCVILLNCCVGHWMVSTTTDVVSQTLVHVFLKEGVR